MATMANASSSAGSSHQNIPELNDGKGDVRVTEWRKRLLDTQIHWQEKQCM